MEPSLAGTIMYYRKLLALPLLGVLVVANLLIICYQRVHRNFNIVEFGMISENVSTYAKVKDLNLDGLFHRKRPN
jgi:hypothetical protein